jgi:hypothetical protein
MTTRVPSVPIRKILAGVALLTGLLVAGRTLTATVLLPPVADPAPAPITHTYDVAVHAEVLRMNLTLMAMQATLATCATPGPGRGPGDAKE